MDLSKVECNKIRYNNQKDESIKNHKLPNSLKKLIFIRENITILPKLPNSLKELCFPFCKLTSLPDLPNSLEKLNCHNNQLTSFANTQLPISLKEIYCSCNQLTSLPDLPDSLKILYCPNNQLMSLLNLPNSLEKLDCYNNKLTSFTNLTENLILSINQNVKLDCLAYYKNVKIYNSNFKIKDYPITITNQESWDEYMDYKLHKMSRIKSARK